jgi:hypothetical protein
MKIALAILLVILAVIACGCTGTAPATPAAAPTVTVTTPPSLTGIWTGTSAGHFNAVGFREQLTPKYNVTVQKGQSFVGYVEYTRPNGTRDSEEFSGVINNRGEIYMAQVGAGVAIGYLSDPDTMKFSYIEDGSDAKALIAHLNRQKS